MFRTLYSKIALTLFILLCLVGLSLVLIISRSNNLYQQEIEQKLNRDLAAHIISEYPLIQSQQVNKKVLDQLFHQLMIVNPSIELYLVDKAGNILGFSAPPDVVKLTRVDLAPVHRFLSENSRFPLKGDDPRNPHGQKVFTAARIMDNDTHQGYLYIVLASEQYDHVVDMLDDSYIFLITLAVVVIALLSALVIGLVIFAVQTRRLRQLGQIMQQYSGLGDRMAHEIRYPNNHRDEIDSLGYQFNLMADKISAQILDMKQLDDMRREMVANISHDLRTPLTTMRGYLETLYLKGSDIELDEHQKYVAIALKHSEHLAKMVEELFELARLDSVDSVIYSEPYSIGELVQDVTQKFQLKADSKSITLNLSLNPSLPMVYGDIAMMQRVLENLIANGLRHTSKGGQIDIGVDFNSGQVIVQVADTGTGIPVKDIPKIFERFYQQDKQRSSGGAGLGLAIVKRILELHGSVINVKSKLEEGTTFTFDVPSEPIVMKS